MNISININKEAMYSIIAVAAGIGFIKTARILKPVLSSKKEGGTK